MINIFFDANLTLKFHSHLWRILDVWILRAYQMVRKYVNQNAWHERWTSLNFIVTDKPTVFFMLKWSVSPDLCFIIILIIILFHLEKVNTAYTVHTMLFPNAETCEKKYVRCKKNTYSVIHYIHKNKLQRVFICM